MKFSENEYWQWNKMKPATRKFVMQEVKATVGSTDISGNGLSENSVVEAGSSSSNNSPNMHIERMSDSSVDTLPTQKVRTLREIYEGCSFALVVTDPSTYEETIKYSEWREAMNDEIKAIDRKKPGLYVSSLLKLMLLE